MALTVLVNPGAGDEQSSALAETLKSAGLDASVEEIEGKDIAKRTAELARRGDPTVAVAGGDGSISAAAGALAGTDTALGILPLGTLNHLARDLKSPFDLEAAAEILANGKRRKIDVAELNGRHFVNNSAIGIYPLMVVDRESQQHRLGRSKRLAMLVASFRTLVRFHHERLRLLVNESESELIDTPLLFVGNNDYRLALPAAGKRDRLDDGRLCVLVMRKKGVPGLLAATFRALVGLTRPDDMIQIEDVTRLRVSSSRHEIEVSLDGETQCFEPPLDYKIRPLALTVIAPA